MRKPIRPYQILLLATVSVAMIFFMKINKQSFYHHFFKVIEEVESRNSQEVQTSAPVETIWWTVSETAKGPVLPFLLWLLALATALGGMVLGGSSAFPFAGEGFRLHRAPHWFCPPVRAP
ncbi:MAG: hypothetical protein D6722_25205 [Bacteroidetes bacterium]|nr:MAG: hypothetical protein D6722_25205 [Bacteroidota bacterium]